MEKWVHIMLKMFTVIVFLINLVASEEQCITDERTFVCPMEPDFPPHYTKCCIDEAINEVTCCPELGPKMFNVNSSTIMLASITVMISCLILAAIFIVCCFWSPCPLFDTCRVNYGHRLNIAYAKEEETLNLPPEDDNCSHYSPKHIIIKPLDSEA